jgi:murein DD-endopeptidase MepM/ murein hydrolase activator NlpD
VSRRALLAALAAALVGVVALMAAAAAAVSGSAPPTGGTASGAPAAPAEGAVPASGFALVDARVSPRRAYFAGPRVRITFGVGAPAPFAPRVDIVREATRKPVMSFALPVAATGVAQSVEWDGRTGAGEVAPNGRYRVRVVAPDGAARNAGRLQLRGHIYPIRGRHADRGPAGAFGVGRNGGRTHNGFDVNAACGLPVVAARGGVVKRADYDPVLYGNVVIIRGERTRRDYWYSHLLRPTRLRVGDRVSTGQRIGGIGATGNARTIGCHLHFEIRRRGTPIDAGLAGASIEDFTGLESAPIYCLGHAVARVAAAARAAHDSPRRLVLTARAENHIHGVQDLDDTIARLRAYREAGADVLYAPGLTGEDDIRRVVEAVAPLPVNVLAFAGAPDVARLAALGVKRISVGGAFAFAAIDAVAEAARELREDGTYGFLERARNGSELARRAFDER